MKRFTDTDLWDKEWFMQLSPQLKCLVKFIRDKCDNSGVWQPNWMLAKTYIGEDVKECDLLKIDGGNQFEKLPDGKILCVGFVFFQYGELSENCPPHRKIIALLKKHQIFDRVLKGYRKGINTLQEEEEEKEEDKEEEKDKEEKPKIEITYPFSSIEFMAMWGHWKEYKKAEHKFGYKSAQSEQSALAALMNKSGGVETVAIEVIKQSMANGWKGFFSIKTDNNGTGTNNTAHNKGANSKGVLNADYKADLLRRMARTADNGGNGSG